jgi:nitroreductase / dihydropteridine reductase
MELIKALNWRYATKRMNGSLIPEDKLNNILDAIQLAPSAFGLQPYQVFLIEKGDLRNEIFPIAYKQPQIQEASHLLVFAAWSNISEQQIHDFIANVATTRGLDLNLLEGYNAAIKSSVLQLSPEQQFQWAAKQAYIALGVGLAAAAIESVDSTPMEGFNPEALNKLLGLKEKGLKSVALLTLGYRDAANDALASAKKVRRNKNELFLTLK